MMIAKTRLRTMYDNRTLVFGHRGAMAYAPMNTIPAFELAYEQGADGIEFDVHRSKDGQRCSCSRLYGRRHNQRFRQCI